MLSRYEAKTVNGLDKIAACWRAWARARKLDVDRPDMAEFFEFYRYLLGTKPALLAILGGDFNAMQRALSYHGYIATP